MSVTTNGASLEDCLTNIFSLIDLNGIRWKRFRQKETSDNNHLYNPILTTYAKCIEENHIAVWRHQKKPRNQQNQNQNQQSSTPSQQQQQHHNQQQQTSTILELWIFGYGNQLNVDNLIGDDLIEIEDDTWEQRGLSYECRTLLFKALHNSIDRCLANQGYTRIGRWFVQPQKSHLSYAFNFFVHGDSTICAAVDVRQHPPIQPITKNDLNTFQSGGIVRVVVAPYGLNGILNGVSYKDSDNGTATISFIQQWAKFYPLPKTLARLVSTSKQTNNSGTSAMAPTSSSTTSLNLQQQKAQPSDGQNTKSCLPNLSDMLLPGANKPSFQFNHESHEVPPVVEVIVAGHRMRYPSECIFTTSRVVDPYRSQALSSPISKMIGSKRFNSNNNSNNIQNHNISKTTTSSKFSTKASLLSEKLGEDKTDTQPKIKIELDQPNNQDSIFNTPFRVDGSNKNTSYDTSTNLHDTLNNQQNQQHPTQQHQHKDKDSDGTINAQNSSITNTRLTTITGFNHHTTLLPTELVKLFPTPPSLEQIVASPAGNIEESSKEPAPSPANQNEFLKDNGIDVYRPVEFALMPPPPKWAALSNIIVSRTLPPNCIYKGSPHKTTKELTTRFSELTGKKSLAIGASPKSSSKHLSSLLDKSKGITASPSPLTDSTNKTGFNPATPKSSILSTSLMNSPIATSNSMPLFSPASNSLTSVTGPPSTLPASTLNALSSVYTLPHQRLFNNLNEINSLQLHHMLSDSVLGMFQDHNFENCTLCVCNMSIKGTHPDSIILRPDSQSTKHVGSESPSFGLSSGETNNECTCGFSAITNRHYSHLSGLFFEDELEITNVLYDPTEMIDQHKMFRKVRLSAYSDSSLAEEQKILVSKAMSSQTKKQESLDESTQKQNILTQEEKSSQYNRVFTNEETKVIVIGHLKQQCSTMVHSNSPLARVIMIESFRNNRHLTSCVNYYAHQQPMNSRTGLGSPFHKLLDDQNKYTQVRMFSRNPNSLKFSDHCEITRNILVRLSAMSPQQTARLGANLLKSSQSGSTSNLSAIFSRLFGPARTTLVGKPMDHLASIRHNIFTQGLQALVMPTLMHDAKGALQMLEQILQDDSKEALATLNKAILILSSPMHDWQFQTAPVPENNFDVVNLLKSIQPCLEQAIGLQNKIYKDYVHQQQQHIFSARDSPTGEPTVPTPPCQGPLTWRVFQQTAGRGTEDQCEPQPIPSLLVSHHVDKNHIAVSPFALKFWDKLSLEPYAPSHNMYYLVLAPDSQNVTTNIHTFFKELSNIYDLMKLGKHSPIGNGLLLASTTTSADNENSNNNNTQMDELFGQSHMIDENVDSVTSNILLQLKNYAAQMNTNLAKTISDFIDDRMPPYDPLADRFDSSTSSSAHDNTKNSALNRLNQLSQHSNQHGGLHTNPLQQQKLTSSQQSSSQANRPFVSLLGNQQPGPPNSNILGLGGMSQQQQQQQQQSMGSEFGASANLPGLGMGLTSSSTSSSGLPGDSQQSSMASPFGDPAGGNLYSKTQTLIGAGSHGTMSGEDGAYNEDESNKQSGIVIYIIDPFASPSLTQNQRSLALIGLFKCYSILLDLLPENLRRITQLQLISLDSVINHSKPLTSLSRIDQLKSLAMNVYCHCRKILTNQITAKSLTGFGPAAALESFFKSKNPDLCASKMFTPPFILAPLKDKQTEIGEMFGDRREKSSVLFCSYCITEDQRWLLASVTNDKGEMSESTVININVLDRLRRPKSTVRRFALKRLMDFIISVMSDWVNPWRLIIGKLGRVGHGELKEWASLLSKRSLLSYSRHLTERCRQCCVLPPNETVSILSACLVSFEPDSKLRIMADQFTTDDRQASFNKCPLSTPEDATVTHILVFPTSASIQATHENVEDPLVGSGLDDDLLNQFPLDDGMEDLGVEGGMDDLFSAWDDPGIGGSGGGGMGSSHHDTLLSSSGNLQMGGAGGGSMSGVDMQAGGSDELLQLLQQPLALGYYISTAKLGQMPNWFWSTNPHLRNSCPTFLKSALHIHMPSVQSGDDLLHQSGAGGRKTHQLDSNLTSDVLRYVLEGYNSLSWLSLNPKTFDRQSCLPIHMQCLLQLYHLIESLS